MRRLHLPRATGVRQRAALAVAAVAAALVSATSVAVWASTSEFLVERREASAVTQARGNAAQVGAGLVASGRSAADLLAELPRESDSTSLLLVDGSWTTTSLAVGPAALPGPLVRAAEEGRAVRQRIELDGSPALAVALPLPREPGGAYVEVFPLAELDSALRTVGLALGLASVVSPLLALLLAPWVVRPALKPLETISSAAAAIADGDHSARLAADDDPDLAPLAATFNRTAEAMERRVRQDARFAADVSHELRSPLTSLVAAASLLEDQRDHLDGDGRAALALLTEELQRFSRLVEDLLEISRLDAGSAEVVPEDVAAVTAVRSALAPSARAALDASDEADDVWVRTDPRRLARALAGLVDNAEHHGGGLRAVRVELAPDGGWVRVHVDDAGPGVAAQDRARVLERFSRGRSVPGGSTTGAGLGLSLVVRSLAAAGGRLELDRSPEGGARFTVVLPVARAGAADLQPAGGADEALGAPT